jgi:hypothetical protein
LNVGKLAHGCAAMSSITVWRNSAPLLVSRAWRAPRKLPRNALAELSKIMDTIAIAIVTSSTDMPRRLDALRARIPSALTMN